MGCETDFESGRSAVVEIPWLNASAGDSEGVKMLWLDASADDSEGVRFDC